MAHSATAVTLEQYLSTSYRPDVEFLEGELRARSVVSPVHGRVQMILGRWFGNHEEEWGVQVVAETRTKVSVERVRLPDVAVLAAGPLPARVLIDPPIVVIEVRSATDSSKEFEARALDLAAMGVKNIWLLDPKEKSAEVWSGGVGQGLWTPARGNLLYAIHSPVYLDLAWLWEKVGVQAS